MLLTLAVGGLSLRGRAAGFSSDASLVPLSTSEPVGSEGGEGEGPASLELEAELSLRTPRRPAAPLPPRAETSGVPWTRLAAEVARGPARSPHHVHARRIIARLLI